MEMVGTIDGAPQYVCPDSADKMENITGFCSLSCQLGHGCDESCRLNTPMRLDILVESENLDSSPDSLKFDAMLAITTTQNIKSKYSKDVAREYIKNLPIEDVKEMASDSSPIVVDFYECVENKKLEDFLPIQRRFYHYLKSDAISKTSKKYRYFDELLSLGERYDVALDTLKAFLGSVLPDDEIALKKIGAIYEKFGNSSSKVFKELFTIYAQYLKTPTPEIKKQILKAYWNNKSNIDDVIDEMYSISGQIFKKTNTPVSKDEQQERNAAVLAYLNQNESDLKWFADKLLHIEYLKELFEKSGQHYTIDFDQIKEFSEKTKHPTTDSIIKNLISSHFPHNSEVTKTANKVKIAINSTSYEKLASFINDLYENGRFTIDSEISIKNPSGKFGTPYKILYSMYNTNGVNYLHKVINDFYNLHGSANKVLSEMSNSPEDVAKIYKKLGMKFDDNTLRMSAFIHNPKSFEDQFKNKVAVLENAYSGNEDEYNKFISESLEKMSKRENPYLSLKDALRDVEQDDLTVHSYKMLINELRNPESKYISFIINRVGKSVFSLIMNGKMLEKNMKNLFVECVGKDQDEVIGTLKFRQAGNINQALNLIEFLDTISERFSPENQSSFIDGISLVLSKFLNDPNYFKNYAGYVEKMNQIIELMKKYNKNDKLIEDVSAEINKGSDE